MPSHTLDHLENLIVDRQDAVAIVTVNRPRVLNAPVTGH
jgi:enoyl-CoA hydratase/carnithine racemase